MGEWEDGLWEYNCHVFAWNNWQAADRWSSESDMWKLGKPSPYNLMWRSYPDVWYTDTDNPIGIVSYVSASSSEAAICTYSGNHSARIVGNGTYFISKWGSNPIIKHPPTEVPTSYYSVNAYYKINPAYRPIGEGDPAGRDWETISNAISGATSGSLISVLSGTHTLTGNVTVPSGVTLTIASGAMVNYNGYTLSSSGGTISIQSGGIITLNPATYVDFSGSGNTYEVNGINVGASFNGIGQSIKAIPPSGYGIAGWSDGVGGNYREINGNVTVNARLKALHKSNTIAAWDNTSQRKLIQTSAGGNPRWLHQVYTSAGHVWLEHSGDGGSTWTLGNNGQPLDGTAGGKCPSIAFTTHYTGSTTDNYIGVVWQEK